MKKLLTIFFLLTATASFAQVDTARKLQPFNGYGLEMKNFKVTGSVVLPRDTFQLKVSDSGAIAYKNGKIWLRGASSWTQISGSGGSGTSDYNDLINKPTIPTNTNQLTNGAGFLVASDITNKVDKITGKGLSTEDYTTAEQSKLAGIASGATANSTDAQLRDRSTHTGTQAATTITEDATHRFATDAEKTTWNAKQSAITTGTTLQYFRGDFSLATFPTNLSSFTNGPGYITQSGARTAISLTTTGTSGAATYDNTTGVLNIPQYAVSGGGTGTVTDFSAGDLSPLFTTTEATTTSTPALSFSLSSAAAHKFFGNATGSTAAPSYSSITTADLPDLSGTYQPLDGDLTTIAGLTATTDNFLVATASAWASRTPTQAKTSLGVTTAGNSFFTLTNPSAITFPRINADNSVSALDAATFRTAIGAGTSSTAGTVTSASVVSANGFAGTVATASSTPAITLTTSITGVLKGNGTAISAATSGTDYAPGTSALATGILKSTTTTGGLTIAVAADFPTLNQSTTGSAATLTTPRSIYGNNFDGSAALGQIIASTFGGTGNGFTKFSGPATSEKTFTLPNASATILTDNALVTAAQGGTANGFTAFTGPTTSTKTFTLPNASATVLTDNAAVTGAQGGTGVSNSGKTITLGGNLTTSGAFATTFTVGATTNVTLPSTGTLATLAGTETFSSKTLSSPVINTPTGIVKGDVGLGNVDNTSDASKNSATVTMTNHRWAARAGNTTSSATPTINTDNVDYFEITAQAVDITSMTTNLTGTPSNDDVLHIAITGTAARAITWGTKFEASTIALPTTTVTTNRLDCVFSWNATTSKWRIGGTW
jgi:hypothetical protein